MASLFLSLVDVLIDFLCYNSHMKLNNIDILNAISKKPLGTGTEAVIYDAGEYLIRIPKKLKTNTEFKKNLMAGLYKQHKAHNIHGKRNFGQPRYHLIDNVTSKPIASICKKIDGIATNDLVEEPLTNKQIINAQETALKKMRLIASAPQKSFKNLIESLNYLAKTDFTIDPSEGNMLINPQTKRFYIIDLRPIKNIRNIGDLILLLLTDIPNMPYNQEYYDLEFKIITKLIRAAQSCGMIYPEQLKLKPRALEVIKSEPAKNLYLKNYSNIPLR